MVGHYSAGNFHIISGSGGTVEIVDPLVVSGGSVQLAPVQALPRHGIDQPVLGFGGHGTLAYSQAATVGNTPAIPDGRHAATIALFVNYMAGNFATAADGRGGTLISETPQTEHAPLLARPHG